ncbi:MAG: hypothetical protein ACOYNI_07815 [Acidimicrobiia bacterium]
MNTEIELLPADDQESALNSTLAGVNNFANVLIAEFEGKYGTSSLKELKSYAREHTKLPPVLTAEAVRKAHDALILVAKKKARYTPRQAINFPEGKIAWKSGPGKVAMPTAKGNRSIPVRQPAGGWGGTGFPLDGHPVQLVERAGRYFLVSLD